MDTIGHHLCRSSLHEKLSGELPRNPEKWCPWCPLVSYNCVHADNRVQAVWIFTLFVLLHCFFVFHVASRSFLRPHRLHFTLTGRQAVTLRSFQRT